MNPYSDITVSRPSDLTLLDDVTSSPPVPAPPLYSAFVPTDQSERPQCTDESEFCNPYADVVFPSSVSDHSPMVRSEAVDVNGDSFLSADHTDQSDAWNPHGLSIVTAQFEAEAQSEIPDLECSICFSQFNNAFRCPKKLQCGHTFCLECLARMNVKSPEPSAVQCPLCRALTPLPTLGLPKLSTDPQVLSCLPSSMQRVYSVRFLRNKGRLQLKRPDSGTRTLSTRRSLDVGLPSPVPRGAAGGRALFRLTDRPGCRALLLAALILMIVLLTALVVFLITIANTPTP